MGTPWDVQGAPTCPPPTSGSTLFVFAAQEAFGAFRVIHGYGFSDQLPCFFEVVFGTGHFEIVNIDGHKHLEPPMEET